MGDRERKGRGDRGIVSIKKALEEGSKAKTFDTNLLLFISKLLQSALIYNMERRKAIKERNRDRVIIMKP